MDIDISHIDQNVIDTCSEAQKIEYAMFKSNDKVNIPSNHVFTPGLYARTVFMPAGSLVMSMTHKTRHPFVISAGEVDVITPDGTMTHIGPYLGITEAGTKRLLHVKSDTIWTTFHANPNNVTDPDEISKNIIEELHNPLLNEDDLKFQGWQTNASQSTIVNAVDNIHITENKTLKMESEVAL